MTEESPYYEAVADANRRASITITEARCAANPIKKAEAEITRLSIENARLTLAVQAWRGFSETSGSADAGEFEAIEADADYQAWGVNAENRMERQSNERRHGSGSPINRRRLCRVVAGPADR